MTRRIESRIHREGDLYRFEILDSEDKTVTGEAVLMESLHLSNLTYANESTAKRHADSWISRFRSATEAIRRTLCGYDSVEACKLKLRSRPRKPEHVATTASRDLPEI